MSNRPVGRPMGGRRMNRMGGGEKAKDFRGTIQKLLKYMSAVSYTHLNRLCPVLSHETSGAPNRAHLFDL